MATVPPTHWGYPVVAPLPLLSEGAPVKVASLRLAPGYEAGRLARPEFWCSLITLHSDQHWPVANLLLAKHSDQHWPTFFLQSILIITGQYFACKAFWSALANLLIAMHSDQHWPTFLLQNILISTGQPSSCKAFWSAMANLSLVKHCDLKTLTTFCFFLSVELIKQLLIKANICQSFCRHKMSIQWKS